ncbi:MAG TPA: SRPBCC family protein [Novosphingobium sp.]|nr:SRPBCC family protein [Novosphingobium sp.]
MRIVIGLIAAAAFAAPAQGEVLQKSDAGFVTRATATVAKPPLEAWLALIAPAKWWNKAHSWSGDSANLYLDPQATGCFCEFMPFPKDAPAGTRRGSVEHMHVIYADPGKVLRMSGSLGPLQSEALNATLTVTLKPVEGGTRILFEYVVGGYMRFKTDEIAPAVDGVMSEQLGRLAAYLGPVGEAAPEAVPEPPAPEPEKAEPALEEPKFEPSR